MVRGRIRNFQRYVSRPGEDLLEHGGSKQTRLNVGSIQFFLSYFWQIRDGETWPVYYSNSVNTMGGLNLRHPMDDLAEKYITYKDMEI